MKFFIKSKKPDKNHDTYAVRSKKASADAYKQSFKMLQPCAKNSK